MHFILRPDSTKKNIYWEGFLSILRNYPNNGFFLEIGAVDSERINEHSRLLKRLIGLDLNFAGLPKQSGIPMVNADAQFLPFKDNTFDGIISHHVIEHVDSDDFFMLEIKRTLKKGGFAILGTPNRRRLIRAVVEALTEERKFPWREHKREYTKQDLLRLVEKLGFQEAGVFGKFLGIHPYWFVFGFSRFPRIFDKWCSFLFVVVKK